MIIQDFMQLVRDMRTAQNRYFRFRDPNTLREAKELEIRVDKAIREFFTPSLFP